jgi:flagellar basal body-associated protein FliL
MKRSRLFSIFLSVMILIIICPMLAMAKASQDTGATANILLYIILAAMAILLIAGILTIMRRTRRYDEYGEFPPFTLEHQLLCEEEKTEETEKAEETEETEDSAPSDESPASKDNE